MKNNIHTLIFLFFCHYVAHFHKLSGWIDSCAKSVESCRMSSLSESGIFAKMYCIPAASDKCLNLK